MMESLILGGTVIAFAGAVGTDLIISAVQTTSRGVINGINYIYSSDRTGADHIKLVLIKLDIMTKVAIINSFINELNEDSEQLESITTSLISVENVLQNIEKEIKSVNRIINEHNQKWFASWRTIDYNHHIEAIRLYNQILDTRVDLLLKLLQIGHTTNKSFTKTGMIKQLT